MEERLPKLTEHQPNEIPLITEDSNPHKVCAYCRVSTDDKDQKNSLEAQISFFQRYFKLHPNWTNVGIFADEGISGTSLEKRDDFFSLRLEYRGEELISYSIDGVKIK